MSAPKLFARLNPATVRYDVGRGGIPELTATDIAGALAFTPAGLGRELICRIWWPAGAELTEEHLDKLLGDALFAEWYSRWTDMLHAQIALAGAKTVFETRRAKRMLEEATRKMWPRLDGDGQGKGTYAAIRRAVLVEMSVATKCPRCGGRGQTMQSNRIVTCPGCEGRGRAHVSDRARADMIQRDASVYRRTWAPVYEWIMQHCTDLVSPAMESFKKAVK